MKFYEWYKANTADELGNLAEKVGKVPEYLSLVARGHKRPSIELARTLAKEIGINPHDLRPDFFDVNGDML